MQQKQKHGGPGKKQGKQEVKQKRLKKSDYEDAEVKKLEAIIHSNEKPASGTNPLSLPEDHPGYAAARRFEQLPMSQNTQDALTENKFTVLTTIQRAAIPHALAGRDILGAAKTGSGKTLTFLIPLLEKMFRARWTRLDGLGGLVLTPTRELAMQIFQELRKVGSKHDFSAGLLIGGKNVKEEQASVNKMNILVATPGRLLQHMDETPGFDASNLQVLVLDEADRLLDMGFAATLDAILDALPKSGRQTMLFSATQTKSVKDLARLSLTDPEYLAVHEASEAATPLKLQQAMAVVPAEAKMDTLWSFVKTHLQAKTIVFLSTCKQVRFYHEVFKKLRPGVPLRALHGGMKQMKRLVTFQEFCQAKHMVLFATDVAGRGLDFPSVDWVVSVDCPEDAAAYIHRVGRTARYLAAGRALMLLTPGESEGMKAALAAAKIPVKSIKINPEKQQNIAPALQALLSKNTQLKEWGQRALTAYVRSVFLAPAKDVFDVKSLDLEALAASWGLAAAPKMRFLKKVGAHKKVVAQLGGQDDEDDSDDDADRDKSKQKQEMSDDSDAPDGDQEADDDDVDGKVDKQSSRKAAKAQRGGKEEEGDAMLQDALPADGSDDDDDGNFLKIKKRNVFGLEEAAPRLSEKAALLAAEKGANKKTKKLKIKLGGVSGQRVVFDEEGTALEPLAALALGHGKDLAAAEPMPDDGQGMYVVADEAGQRFSMAAQLMKQRDKADKARLKELRAALKAEKKARRKAAMAEEQAAGGGVSLGRRGGDDSDDGDDYSDEEVEMSSGGDYENGNGSEGGYSGSDDSDGSDEKGEEEDRPRARKGVNTGKVANGKSREESSDDDDDDDDGSEDDDGDSDVDDQPQKLVGNKRKGVSNGVAASAGKGGGANKKAKKGGELSLAEQEALALQRIASARK